MTVGVGVYSEIDDLESVIIQAPVCGFHFSESKRMHGSGTGSDANQPF